MLGTLHSSPLEHFLCFFFYETNISFSSCSKRQYRTTNTRIKIIKTTIKKDIKMEEAEELKAKLEAVGATVEIA